MMMMITAVTSIMIRKITLTIMTKKLLSVTQTIRKKKFSNAGLFQKLIELLIHFFSKLYPIKKKKNERQLFSSLFFLISDLSQYTKASLLY